MHEKFIKFIKRVPKKDIIYIVPDDAGNVMKRLQVAKINCNDIKFFY